MNNGDKFYKLNLSRGFSLIEVLVAFSIASVSLTIIFQLYASGTTSAILGNEYSHALVIAQSRMEMIGTVEDFQDYTPSGIESDKFYWDITVDEYVPDGSIPDLLRIDLKTVSVTITWDSRDQERSITLQTLKPYFPS